MMGREYPPNAFSQTSPNSAVKLALGIALFIATFFILSYVHYRLTHPNLEKALKNEGNENQ